MATTYDSANAADTVAAEGDAAIRFLPLVYDELRMLATQYIRRQPCNLTLQPTALVHEAYIRMVNKKQCTLQHKAQFFLVASQAMRHILIDHARRRLALKRGGKHRTYSLDSLDPLDDPTAFREGYLIALHEALTDLSRVDGELCQIVELRFFGGLSMDDIAQVMGLAPITIKRRWKLAKSWLHREISGGE